MYAEKNLSFSQWERGVYTNKQWSKEWSKVIFIFIFIHISRKDGGEGLSSPTVQ